MIINPAQGSVSLAALWFVCMILLGGSVGSFAQEGKVMRLIVYTNAPTSEKLQSVATRDAVLDAWGKQGAGEVSLLRRLATGGWVVEVRPGDSTDADAVVRCLQQMEGIETVESDSIMHPQGLQSTHGRIR